MGTKYCTPDTFANVMQGILTEYNVAVVKASNDAVMKTARKDVRDLKGASRIFKSNRRGHKYARSWTFRKNTDELGSASYVVYNREYQLTHLLEKGHDIVRNGETIGHYQGHTHIKPVADRTGKVLEDFFKSGMAKIR